MGLLVLVETDQLYIRLLALHLKNRVNFVVLVHCVHYINQENMANYNHNNQRDETSEYY